MTESIYKQVCNIKVGHAISDDLTDAASPKYFTACFLKMCVSEKEEEMERDK